MKKFITLHFADAVIKSLALVSKDPVIEFINTEDVRSRVLAQDLFCVKNLPSYNNAALDGFALHVSDGGKTLLIQDTIYAGMNCEEKLKEDHCFKIMTGAKVPGGIDTIVPFEDAVTFDDTSVKLAKNLKKGNALRLKGEEVCEGALLLAKGEMLNARSIALLASQGITHVPVYKKVSIGIFSSGDELKEPWQNASEDQIYNINAQSIQSLLGEHSFEATYCGVMPDNLEQCTNYLATMKRFDVLITSGGISMGEADYIEQALEANGFESSFHGINIKPGKPTMMGKMGETIVCSLPGNPLAAFVNAFLFLLPVIKKLQGATNFAHKSVLANNATSFKAKTGRTNIILGKLENNRFYVSHENRYGSGMITPLVQSNAILIIDTQTGVIEADELLEIILF
ncbi:MAG: molybdopterin molybdotransferase MoeA [Sulfurospirillum sp.]|nr:molybdopterin molybdotransferase MoeA [Sulfurospirillum sp.]